MFDVCLCLASIFFHLSNPIPPAVTKRGHRAALTPAASDAGDPPVPQGVALLRGQREVLGCAGAGDITGGSQLHLESPMPRPGGMRVQRSCSEHLVGLWLLGDGRCLQVCVRDPLRVNQEPATSMWVHCTEVPQGAWDDGMWRSLREKGRNLILPKAWLQHMGWQTGIGTLGA